MWVCRNKIKKYIFLNKTDKTHLVSNNFCNFATQMRDKSFVYV